MIVVVVVEEEEEERALFVSTDTFGIAVKREHKILNTKGPLLLLLLHYIKLSIFG